MRSALGLGLTVAAVIGTVLTPTTGWAAVTSASAHTAAKANAPAAGDLATSTTANAPAGSDPDTTVTFSVTVGALTMTAPASATLSTGSGNPGTTITGLVGPDVVTDTRAALAASWTVTASSTDFTTGGSTPAETIPAGHATYTPGTIFTTGSFAATATPITLANGPASVVTGTGVGNNTATWNPTEAVAIPSATVGGPYTSVLTHSVG